mmetsp:Transcript_23116/g.42418  ORF Transcript_23116/g.42418 Transcript_23116/m.42418 type:complete len:208 (-) Transcript_23116:927-1550(-)
MSVANSNGKPVPSARDTTGSRAMKAWVAADTAVSSFRKRRWRPVLLARCASPSNRVTQRLRIFAVFTKSFRFEGRLTTAAASSPPPPPPPWLLLGLAVVRGTPARMRSTRVRGVWPSSPLASASLPPSSSTHTTSHSPCDAAKCSAVCWYKLSASGSAPSASRQRARGAVRQLNRHVRPPLVTLLTGAPRATSARACAAVVAKWRGL